MQPLVRVLRHLGVSFGVLRKEKCTGDAARRLGNDLLFQQLAESNLEALAQAKVKKMLSICPHCVRTIQEDWKEYGTPPAIEHHSEFLARHMDRLRGANIENAPGAANPVNAPGNHEASGHDFSRAESDATKGPGALAPAEDSLGNGKIVFHDPCYLGRYRGIYDEPRVVARAGRRAL